jgi:spoIIIJ-associated protein
MQKSIEVTAKNEEEAIASALRQLNLSREEVSIEIIERAKSGFLGIGSQPAVIKVSFEAPDEPVREQAVKAERHEKHERHEKPAAFGVKEKPVPEQVPRAAAPVSAEALKAGINDFLGGLLSRMGIEAKIDITEREDGNINVELSGEAMGAVIGRRGETLDAIQHLTNYAVNRGSENRRHISIDAENYRSKREESLVRLAEKMAAKALKYKRSMALEPMNSYERHVIHTALQNYEGVSTGSTGTEPNRRVVISCEKGKEA